MATAVFVIPERALEELEEFQEDRLCVSRLSVEEDPGELAKDVAFELGDKDVTCIEERTLFDRLYSLVKSFATIDPSIKRILIETLCSNFTVIIASIASLKRPPGELSEEDAISLRQQFHSHRNALKIYAYFLQQIFVTEEAAAQEQEKAKAPAKAKQPRKKHISPAWAWNDFRGRIVALLGRALESDLYQLYGMNRPDENLLSFFAKFGLRLLEDASIAKDKDTKEALCKYLAACAVKYDYYEQLVPSMADLLHKCEHVAVPLADAFAVSEKVYGDTKLAIGLLREIGMTNPAEYNRSVVVADNVKLFLVELTDRLPKVMAANLSLLVPHFSGDSYKMRNALIQVMGKLLVKEVGKPDGSSNEEFRLRNKQGMIDILIERTRDTNAFTRSCVLQTWMYLCQQNTLSIGLWGQVVDIAAGRLHDKAVHVRKSALQLLTTMLEYNPFGPQLRTGPFEATLDHFKEQLKQMMAENANSEPQTSGAEPAEESVQDNAEIDTQETQESQTVLPSTKPVRSDIGGLEQTRALVASLESALYFSNTVASTVPVVSKLLSSVAVSDVQHAIQFLTTCRRFSVDGSEECLLKMLPLVFSQEKSINEAVESAFITTCMKDKSPQETAFNLVKLTLDATVGDLASIEALAVKLMNRKEIPPGTVSALWDTFTSHATGVTPEQRRGALTLIGMFAKASPTILSPRLQSIMDIGFGRWAKEDVLLARYACIAIQRLSSEEKSNLHSGHKIFSLLSSLITGPGLPDRSWYSAAEQAINAIYLLHPTPERFISALLSKFLDSIFAASSEEQGSDGSMENASGTPDVSSSMLSRFIFAAGHIALKHLVYIESCVRAIRKQRADKERAAADAQADVPEVGAHKEESVNAEIGAVASEDLKLDLLLDKAEKEIVSGIGTRKLLIARVAPVVIKLCRNFSALQQFPRLRSSAVLCLCKLMAVDSRFCDENLQLLFTLAQNSAEESLRSNCIIALGDIAFRFPNLLEPWTEHMYARLHDKSMNVKKNAVLVIAHLVLNDMMKVKGHISEMALQTEVADQRISDLAKLFFLELSKKGTNPIYNLLPDMLSRLSSSTDVNSETFRNVMQFLIGLIKKDKHWEGLIEKMCNRFLGISDRAQWQGIAYFLSQLTYTEKGMKKLVDSFKLFQNALVDEEVLEHLTTICTKAKKLGKPEFRQFVEEFEQNMVKCHEQKREEEREAEKAQARLSASEVCTLEKQQDKPVTDHAMNSTVAHSNIEEEQEGEAPSEEASAGNANAETHFSPEEASVSRASKNAPNAAEFSASEETSPDTAASSTSEVVDDSEEEEESSIGRKPEESQRTSKVARKEAKLDQEQDEDEDDEGESQDDDGED